VSRLKTVDLVVEQFPAATELPVDKAAFQLRPSAVVSLDDAKVMDVGEFAGRTAHAIGEEDLLFDDELIVLVTRKDAVKIKQLSRVPSKIHAVEVQLVANSVLQQAIDGFLNDISRELSRKAAVQATWQADDLAHGRSCSRIRSIEYRSGDRR